MAKDTELTDKIEELLTRGVGDFVDPDGAFREKLTKKARGEHTGDVVIKWGVDPTRPDIHLGHAFILRKLRQFQDLGCKIIFLVGDYTAQIGDPSGKSKTRPEIEFEEVQKNAQTYIDQANLILDTSEQKLSWIRNSDWFVSPLDLNLPEDYDIPFTLTDSEGTQQSIQPQSFLGKTIAWEKTRMQPSRSQDGRIHVVTMKNLLWSLKHLTHSRLIKRDMFQKRIQEGEDLYLHELLYPVYQGIDSYVINEIYGSCDLEVGGTDQTFNMIVGRDIQEKNRGALETHGKDTNLQAVLSFELLEGTDGKEKMSKSLDNYIGITDTPADMYGKAMSIPDALIGRYFELCTYTSMNDIADIRKELESGKLHPREAKMRLAREITSIYHGEKEAENAEREFLNTFSSGNAPEEMPEAQVTRGTPLVDVLLEQDIVSSKSDFRRLKREGAIKAYTQNTWEPVETDTVENDMTLKIGKRTFLRITSQ